MTKHILPFFLLITLLLSACKPAISPESLYGKWNYTKLEKPKANPPYSEADWKLKIEKPYILFLKNGDLQIWWSGEQFSHGKFRVAGHKIMYKESLEGGQIREFPFIVSELTDQSITFTTEGDEPTVVTAVKKK